MSAGCRQRGRDPDTDDLTVGDQFEEIVWPALAARIPAFEAVKVVGCGPGSTTTTRWTRTASWGGIPRLRTWSSPTASRPRPAAIPRRGPGRLRAIAHGGFRTIDLGRFGYERIAAGGPLFEKNVV